MVPIRFSPILIRQSLVVQPPQQASIPQSREAGLPRIALPLFGVRHSDLIAAWALAFILAAASLVLIPVLHHDGDASSRLVGVHPVTGAAAPERQHHVIRECAEAENERGAAHANAYSAKDLEEC
jgi:hypothetical protein